MNKLIIGDESGVLEEEIIKRICLKHSMMGCSCEACSNFRKGTNPDVLFLDVMDKESVKAKTFRQNLDSFYSTSKNMSKSKVMVIQNIDKLSIVCQNILLKYIEDYNDVVSLVATTRNEDKVLTTVKSRMVVTRCDDVLNYEEFEEYCMKKCIGESELYYSLTGGKLSAIDVVGKYLNLWKKIIKLLPVKEEANKIFEVLHLVKEKDKESFGEKELEQKEALFNLMNNVFFERLLIKKTAKPQGYVDNCTWSTKELVNNIEMISNEKQRLNQNYKTKELVEFLIILLNRNEMEV